MVHTVFNRVSNETGQCNFSGQRDRSFFIVSGQRDNGTSSKSCHGTERDGAGQPVKIRDGTITIFFCLRASFPVLEHPFPVLERPFLLQNIFFCFRTSFSCFLSRDICSCPCPVTKGHRDKKIPLSRDKGTTGRPVPLKCQYLTLFRKKLAKNKQTSLMLPQRCNY